ncbi:MAG: bifunctional precorrin-2 dehydrogenase/sirohydrochlorin ferrochelatase [Armatimonadetes bacterium]|nr:bifunctional precorrin-2 dehydrogenase/sirohydrochlorin ferrochelatase [Armatimonadota bacterium]
MIASFPVALIVQGRRCLVIGNDREAAEKAVALCQAGARVCLVCSDPTDEIRAVESLESLELLCRDFEPGDLEEVFLVINCMKGRSALNEAIAAACEGDRFLFCAIDRPRYSNITMASVCERGLLRMTFTTGGTSPAMAKRLRQNLEAVMDGTFVRFTYALADLKERLNRDIPDAARRSEILRRAVQGFALEGHFVYPRWFLEETDP